jgi:ABC-2 type transport system ATP-binding protein
VAQGTATELKQRIADQRLELTLADRACYDELIRRVGERAIQTDPARLAITLPTDGTAAQVRALLDELDPDRRAIEKFAVHGATLDDVFLALTGHPAGPADNPADQADNRSADQDRADQDQKETADV